MKPGFYLVDGDRYYGPIANDNNKRDTYLDERIKRKAEFWAKRLNQTVHFEKEDRSI